MKFNLSLGSRACPHISFIPTLASTSFYVLLVGFSGKAQISMNYQTSHRFLSLSIWLCHRFSGKIIPFNSYCSYRLGIAAVARLGCMRERFIEQVCVAVACRFLFDSPGSGKRSAILTLRFQFSSHALQTSADIGDMNIFFFFFPSSSTD